MPKNKKKSLEDIQNPELFAEIMANWDAVNEVEKDQRTAANEDARFAHIEGEQWSSDEKQARANKPLYEINRVVGSINVTVGEQRQNSISLKTIPLGSGATKDIANTLNGLTRNIENRSHFDNIQADAFKEIATGGYGAWQVSTGYANDQSPNQDISIKGIRDAANSVFFDNGSVEDNHRDAMWCFVLADIPTSQFRKQYPDATPVNIENDKNLYNTDWCNATKNTVRIADYWMKKEVEVEVVFVSKDNVTKSYEVTEGYEKVEDELKKEGFQELNRRKIKKFNVVHYKISGAQILKGEQKWDGKFIPVVMPYGYTIWIEGIRYVRGLVRMAKDSQRLYNYARSAIVEAQALAKTDPTWVTSEAAKGHETEIGKDLPIQIYNSVPNQPPPFKTGAPTVQQAAIEIANQAAADVKATTGLPDQSLGEDPAARSGRAILALQAQGNMGSYELQDNLVKGVEYTDEIIIDLLPRVMDTERQETILNPDGTEELVYINKEVKDEESGEMVLLNDLSLGTYGVLASNGANFKTKRVEAANTLIELRNQDPIVAQTTTDLLLGNLDTPIAPELEKRARKVMLKQGLVEPTEEEIAEAQKNAPQGPSEAEQLQTQITQLELQKLELEAGNLAAEQDKIVAETEKIEADTAKSKADTAKSYADTNKSLADANKNSSRETPSEFNAQERAADAVVTTIEEAHETEIIEEPAQEQPIGNQEELFQEETQPLSEENLQNQQI